MIELMLTLVILAILAGLAVPSFKSTLDRRAIQAEASKLMRAVNLARSKAVTGGVVVTMESLSATNSDWSAGWRIFVDGDNIVSAFDSGCAPPTPPAPNLCDELVTNLSLDSSNITMLSTGNAAQRISFNAQGRLINAGGDIQIAVCDTDQSTAMDGSRVEITSTGRIRVVAITPANKAADCTP